MNKIIVPLIALSIGLIFFAFVSSDTKYDNRTSSNVSEKIKLLHPETSGGMPIMEALKKRKSSRTYTSRRPDEQTFSNLLWAAFGVNREENGKRTAPTANDSRAMDIYVILESATYKYIADDHSLELVVNKDLRSYAGTQDFVSSAPINLVYVSDYSRLKDGSEKEIYSGAHAGFIAENVYLFCTSSGLSTVIRAWVEKEPLSRELNLNENQKVILVQTVGYSD